MKTLSQNTFKNNNVIRGAEFQKNTVGHYVYFLTTSTGGCRAHCQKEPGHGSGITFIFIYPGSALVCPGLQLPV